jgi:uncharacterized membrane protein
MALTWTDPGALWLLLAVPAVWLAWLVTRTNFNRRQRIVQALTRSLLLASLAVAVARPVIATGSSRQSIVYAVDVSHSIAGRAIEDAARKIDDLDRAVRPSHSRILAFGANSAVLADTAALRQLSQLDAAPPASASLDRRGSNLDDALAAARAELAPGHVPRIVLFTDGQQTSGDVTRAVGRLAAERIPVSVEAMTPRAVDNDVWIDSVDLPGRISAGATIAATVNVASQRDVAATIELKAGGKTVETRTIDVAKGVTPVAIDVVFDAPGAQTLQAVVTAAGDPLAANNSLTSSLVARPRPKVLYVEGAGASAHYLAGALSQSGFDVTTRPASGVPSTPAALDAWDVVILSDLSRAAISDGAMAALSDWVEKSGGGLLVAGGEAVFGEDGYRNTQLERLTPVTFERRDEPEVALIIVLDRSWSMAGTSMELCKSAAQAAVDVMTDEQSVGILTFNDRFDWDVPLRNVGKNRDAIKKKIAAIEPGGHTLIYPAVEQAYNALRTAKARAKHVILLSDGRSYPDDYEGLVKKMVDAHITVSSVAVGPAADAELLTDIAKWGKGRSYVVQDPREVPQIFVKEAKNARTPGFDEKTIKPVVKAPGFLEGLDLSRLPALRGRTATVIKDSALELVSTDDGDPLLAFWPVGLGRTAVFASDVKDRWAADWVRWKGYGPFFSSIVRALERQRPPALALEVDPGPIRGRARSMAIGIEARNPDGGYRDLLRPVVHMPAQDGTELNVTARLVAPGRYEADVLADASPPLTLTVAGEPAATASRIVVPDLAAEYRFRPADETLLKSIASATGGAWHPTPALLANAPGDHRTERRPLWTSLLVLALLLWFVDLLLRRVRIFEPRVSVG